MKNLLVVLKKYIPLRISARARNCKVWNNSIKIV